MKKILLFIFSLIVLFLLGFTAATIISKSMDDGYNYKSKNGEYRIDVTQIENITIYSPHVKRYNTEYIYRFRNKPEDLENLDLEEGIMNKLNRPSGLNLIYVTRDQDLNEKADNNVILAVAAFEPILGNEDYGLYQVKIKNVYTTQAKDIPAVTCKGVSATDAVIYLKIGNETRVYSEDNGCVIIQGRNGDELIKAAEKFGYHLIGMF